jgi:hypothetical protein
VRRLAPLLVTLALVAGCGDDESGDATVPAEKGGSLELTLDADGDGGKAERTASLTCPGASGPQNARVCAEVVLLTPDDADAVPADMACTEIYGGPDVAVVTGTLEGEAIDTTLTRANGCEIERFDRWVPLLREVFPGYVPGEALRP